MKKYIKPTTKQIVCEFQESYMLESSMIDTGGSGRFDTRIQNYDDSEWDTPWENPWDCSTKRFIHH